VQEILAVTARNPQRQHSLVPQDTLCAFVGEGPGEGPQGSRGDHLDRCFLAFMPNPLSPTRSGPAEQSRPSPVGTLHRCVCFLSFLKA
jgi:hypothetical protein